MAGGDVGGGMTADTYEAIRERAEQLYRAENPDGDFSLVDNHVWRQWMNEAERRLTSEEDAAEN